MERGTSRHKLQLAPVPDHRPVDAGAAPAPRAASLQGVSTVLRAAWRRKWIAAAVLLMGVDASVAYYRLKPAVYRVEAILAQRPQAASPARSEAARAAPAPSAWEMVHRRENLLALIGETSLLGPSAAPPAGADPRERRRTASDPGADPALTLARRLDHAIQVVADEDTITVAI